MSKVTRILNKVISISLLITIFSMYGMFIPSYASDQDVNISISSKPKIDIVLSKARSKTDMTKFENDIKQALIAKNIDPNDVKITAVSAEQVNIETAFSWKSDVSSSIGSLTITNNGQNVVMKGNQTNAGKNAIWIEPDGNQEQSFTMGYSINFGDSFNAAGMLLRVKETNKTNHALSGYMLSFNNSSWNSAAGGYNGAIWKFVYDGNNTTNMTKTLVKALSINKSGTLSVSATDSEIKISGGGLSSEVTCAVDENYTTGNGFGFFSDHYSHNCDQIGSFQLTNINLTAVTTKSFKEVLQLPEWRDDSLRFIVNVDDYVNEELNDQTAYSELLTKLMNEDIHYVSWGNDKNKTQFQNLIQSNNGKGVFTYNTNYSNAISATATYIKNVVDQNTSSTSQYVIVNEPINISVTPSGIMTNTADSQWPYGKWKIVHDYTYFENDLGQFAESGKLIPDLLTTFDKTGKYEIYYKDLHVYPSEIFVHRKPVAQIELGRVGNNITLTSASYDLDNYSKANKGIAEEEWKWKTSDITTWTTGKLTTVDPSKDYTISLRVKDNQNTWSNTSTLYITSNSNAAPVASFSITNPNITNYETLSISDASYDPAGGSITGYSWEIYKGNTKIYTGSTPKTNYVSEGAGEYTMYLTVTNNRGYVSEKFGRKFTVTNDDIPPEVVVTPVECDWKKSQTVHLEFSDLGKSGVKYYKYAITNNQSTPSSWSSAISKVSDNITINTDGQKYLHIIAEDNAGNISTDRITGPYKIDNASPQFNITGNLTNEAVASLQLNIKTTDSLSGVKSVTLNGTTITSDANCIFTKNGTYLLKTEDYVGNTRQQNIVISNITYECTAGLGHPHYSSDYDNCPICSSYSGLTATNVSKTYNANLQGISYSNPSNATIIEYYNSVNQKVKDADTYTYNLKVKYNNVEYNTGVNGTFTINPKILNISNVRAETRAYDTTDVVEITGGELLGIIGEDDVSPIVPETGTVEHASPGNWKVAIEDIGLEGSDSHNYSLSQLEYGMITATITPAIPTLVIECPDKIYDGEEPSPSKVSGENTSEVQYLYYNHEDHTEIDAPTKVGVYDIVGYQETDGNYTEVYSNMITFQITPKELTIENIETIEKAYDTNNIIELTGGDLVGIVGDDDVSPVVPETGLAEFSVPGNWKVEIEEITLVGDDAYNYYLTQPLYGEIMSSIIMAVPSLVIECPDKIYDGEEPSPSKVSGENTSDVYYFYFLHDSPEPIETPSTIGIYDVVAYQESDGNYEEIVSDKITFEISPKELVIENLTISERPYDTTNIVYVAGGDLVGVVDGDDVVAILPGSGLSENSTPGEWKVVLEDITIEGDDSFNYYITQPEYGSVIAKIVQALPSIQIECPSKVYDGVAPSPTKISGENESEVNYVYYNYDTDTVIEPPTKVGKYDVIGYQESDGNYEAINSVRTSFEITPKDITIDNIEVVDRPYDTTNSVKITNGTLVGVIENDDIYPIIPKIGLAEKATPGTWKVQLDEITLSGKDAYNYNIIQPEYGAVQVTISEASSTLVISCEDKVYDGEAANPIRVSSINTSEITYKYFVHNGRDPFRNPPTDAGVYDVIGYQESDGNYEEVQSDRITFEILPKELTITGIKANNKDFDSSKTVTLTGGSLNGIIGSDDVSAIIPQTGEAESSEAGTWKVSIGEITLQGEKASNYTIVQPNYGDTTVTIIPKIEKTIPKTGDNFNVIMIILSEISLIALVFGYLFIFKT